jgi:competence protein ComEC
MAPVLVAMAGGIVIDHGLASIETSRWIGCALAAGIAACLTMPRKLVSSLALLAGILAMGGAWHHFRWNDYPADDLGWSASESPKPVWIRGFIRELMGVRASEGYGNGEPDRIVTRMVMELDAVCDGKRWRPASGRCLLIATGDRTDIKAGDPVEVSGQLALVPGPLNPGEFDYRSFLRAQSIRLRLVVDSSSGLAADSSRAGSTLFGWVGAIRASCRARLAERLDARVAPLAAALILGQREDIDPEINDAFARTGTTHLLAISGLQLQALALALGLALRLLRVPRRLAYACVGLVTIGYAVLVGLAPSVVRSAVMTLTFCLATIVNHPTRSANTLSLAAVITLSLNPFHLFDVGCQLSFLAIAALIWLVPTAQRGCRAFASWFHEMLHGGSTAIKELERRFDPWWRQWLRQVARVAGQGILASTVVWLAALPLVALRFHLVSPIGILLNIPLIPLTSIALLLGAAGLALGLCWAPLAWPPIVAANVLLQLTELIVRWGVAQPWGHRFVAGPSWVVVLGFYGMLGTTTVAAALRWKTHRRLRLALQAVLWCGLAGSLASGWLLSHVESATTQGDVLAVGHGLAVVIQLPGGHTLLYDCGRMGDSHVGRRIIAPAIWSRGVNRIDSVYLSHADQDHYNALPDLLDRFSIGEVVIPPGFVSPENPGAEVLLDEVRKRGIPVRNVAAPAAWDRGGARFTVLHPPAQWHPESSDNARSLVLEVAFGGRHLLLTGDLDQLGLVELVARPRPAPIDLLLSPHHGGRTANPAVLYNWARPRTVVVSQRRPTSGTTDALTPLDRDGIPLLRTWQRGAVRFEWRSDRITTEGFLASLRDNGS